LKRHNFKKDGRYSMKRGGEIVKVKKGEKTRKEE